MVGSAVVHGQPGRTVRIELPHRIDLYSIPRLDAAGTLTFRFGGRLTVSSDADGDYRGDLPITVEYL